MKCVVAVDNQDQKKLPKVSNALFGLIDTSSSEEDITDRNISDQIKMEISIFQDIFGKKLKTHKITWNAIEELLSDNCTHLNKSDCKLLKLAVFGDKTSDKGSLRNDKNILEIYGIEGDYDAGKVSINEAAAKLDEQGLEACFYTTPRHTPENPRWRVLIPLSKGFPPSERNKFVKVIDSMLGNILAPESYTLSQILFWQSKRCSL